MSNWLIAINRFIFSLTAVYKHILHTLFQWTSDQACAHILDVYDKRGFCIVDYLYFANIAGKKLFQTHALWYPTEDFRDALLTEYKSMNIHGIYKVYQDAILDADVVLPDGIALQIFYYLAHKKRLHNLNGTDFCPYFLSYVQEYRWERNMNVILYGTYPHLLEKTKQLLLKQWYNVIYAQDGYTNLDRENVELAMKWRDKDINILLIARSTPDYPIQEIRSFANKKSIRDYWLIVLNQWGTFDFWVGEQKRPPKFIRTLRLEWLRRLVSDPKRNMKKVRQSLALFTYIFSYLLLKNK